MKKKGFNLPDLRHPNEERIRRVRELVRPFFESEETASSEIKGQTEPKKSISQPTTNDFEYKEGETEAEDL